MIFWLLFFGAGGGVLGQLLQYLYMRSLKRDFYVQRAFAIVAVASVSTFLNFYFVAGTPIIQGPQQVISAEIYFPILIHFGVFVSLFMDEYYPVGGMRDDDIASPRAYTSISITTEEFLVLTGSLQIFGGGCFGSFLVQLERLHSKWKRSKRLLFGDFVFSAASVVSGGIAVLFYNLDQLNALTAMALGASMPMLGKKLQRMLD